jgi:hypothetical protein
MIRGLKTFFEYLLIACKQNVTFEGMGGARTQAQPYNPSKEVATLPWEERV